MDMLKLSIEDNAFQSWKGDSEESALEFSKEYLENFPGFEEKWNVKELAKVLMERL